MNTLSFTDNELTLLVYALNGIVAQNDRRKAAAKALVSRIMLEVKGEAPPAKPVPVKPVRARKPPPAPLEVGHVVMCGSTGWRVQEIRGKEAYLAKNANVAIGWVPVAEVRWVAGQWKLPKSFM